jgi:GAF domain-containing protein
VDIEAVRRELGRLAGHLGPSPDELIDYLGAIIHFALLELPTCVGVSITVVAEGVPYTVTATSPEMQIVDASQYIADGPCVRTATEGGVTEIPELTKVPEVLDEDRWQLYAQVAAAAGVQSSLSLPLLFKGETVGALNFYGDNPQTFDDRAHMLAEMISGHAALAIFNADLSFRTAEFAAATKVIAQVPRDPDAAQDRAVGVLMQLLGIRAHEARERLHSAAARAGVAVPALATALLELATPEQPPS